ncbi:unnamed protein product [Strongylus vulgaris]|uniref:Clc-like protein n=1 Tax=Strongylus vulgaris TaxID=40348 RepID=A0A3P7J3H9_STRVU|nr:unnamed protein product [Strongylus vulgaris]
METNARLERCWLVVWLLSIAANVLLIIGTLTPAWQVAEDTDVGRYVQSGLWLYCPGATQCWYIFSDNLINYYEKVDVCRFLLIGDCRKKLLRTPYFFGRISRFALSKAKANRMRWHYAVLVLNIVTICLISCGVVVAALRYKRPERRRIFTILFDAFICFAVLLLGISLIVFVVNAEMLESKYLIGVKNTFEKSYGYSFYLACTALLMLVFSAFGAILLAALTFFSRGTQTNAADNHYPTIAQDFTEQRSKSPLEVRCLLFARIWRLKKADFLQNHV